MKCVLVTGGNGYLGSVLVQRARARGHRVVVVDNRPASPDFAPDDVVSIVGDVRFPRDWSSALRQVDQVVHLAAIVGDAACDRDADLAWETNYLGTVRLAEQCRRHGVRDLVFASTCSNYGTSAGRLADVWSPVNPLSLYARTKTLAEHYLLSVRGATLSPSILRFATLYGVSPRMRFDLVVNQLTAAALHDGVITVHGGAQWRPFLHVRDAADAVLATLSTPTAPVHNCGSTKENLQIARVAELVAAEVPEARVVISAARSDPRDYRVDFDGIRQQLGFVPRLTVSDGIRELADAIRNGHYPDYRAPRYHNHLDPLRTDGQSVGSH
jgi:nucleoside-diphosphate-sugar epimerase